MTPASEESALAIRRSGPWFVLALAALGLSAIFAVVLVVARMPFLGQGAAWFRTALVLHVDLAVHVWFLAMAAGIWTLSLGAANPLRWPAFGLALGGTLAMLIAPMLGAATPILSNYVPLLDHPVFVAGLGSLALGSALGGFAALAGRQRAVVAPWQLAARFAALAMFATCVVLALDFVTTPAAGAGIVGVDDRLWGAGHAIQFVHILLLMGAWCVLGDKIIAPRLQRALPWLLALALLPAAGAPLISMLHPVGSGDYRQLYTALMRWGTWPGASLLGLALIAGLLRARWSRKLTLEELGLGLSLLLFAVGCLLGASIRGESLAVPAHYHGTVGAVTLAYLLWLRRLASDLGLTAVTISRGRTLPLFYGVGVLVLVAGLAGAGSLGIPRKAAHADLSIDTATYFAAMGTAGIGGFIALSAVLALVTVGLRQAWQLGFARAEAPRRDARPWAVAATLLLVVGGGLLLEWLPGAQPPAFSPRKHAAEKLRADIDQRFQQGVIMLHAKQYEHALTAFHRVMQLAPEMPEAYVNTGYALLGLKRFREARDFFDSATMLRRQQVNAYYGLALALAGMGELDGALGAMRAYIHLSKADDPFRAKAEAAILEWREALNAQQRKNAPAN